MNHNLANFLRDFAAANNADFEPEQVQNLVYAANEIENLQADCQKLRSALRETITENVELANSVYVLEKQYGVVLEERDNARWEVCELSSNGSIDDAMRISVERGWSVANTTQYWCDWCADPIEIGNEFFYSDLPCDIASANKGESGTVCRKCNERFEAERFEADYYNDNFRSTDMS